MYFSRACSNASGLASTPTTDAAVRAEHAPSRSPRRTRGRRRGARGARRDPLVDDQVAPEPVVLLRHVGQRALAGERERRHAVRLVALDVELASSRRATIAPGRVDRTRAVRRGKARWPNRRRVPPTRAHTDAARHPAARPASSATATSPPSTASTSTSRGASSSRCSGPSGSGKTTTLRLIAGFELPDDGDGRARAATTSRGLPPYARDVNTVFQDYALFPHMTVARERRVRAADQQGRRRPSARRRAAEALEMVRLRGLRRPQARAALRRPAPARRARARDRQPPAGAAARRAARRARPQAAPGDAGRAQAHPAARSASRSSTSRTTRRRR